MSSMQDKIRDLEAKGLLEVQRKPGRRPVVKLLPKMGFGVGFKWEIT